MNDNIDTFIRLEDKGAKALAVMRKAAFKPDLKKTLRTWSLTELCDLISRTPQSIRDHEKKENIPKAKINPKTKKRFYTLKDMNVIRDFLGIRPQKPKGSDPAIISFTNFKGGVAKTTSAIHSAQYFARAGYKVLLVDADSQASATACFGYAPDEDIEDRDTLLNFFLGEESNIKNCIRNTYWDGLDLIPANLSLYGVELELPLIFEDAKSEGLDAKIHAILASALSQVKAEYDIIIIDCPPSMSILNTNALYASNSIIVTVPPELPDIASMVQFFGMIKGALRKFKHKQYSFVKVLLTKHDGSVSSNSISDALRHIYGSYVMRSDMNITQVVKKARAEMSSVYEVSKYRGSKATLVRATQLIDNVNKEIEGYILNLWGNAKTSAKKKAKKNVEVSA